MEKYRLWGGRFESSPSSVFLEFSQSIDFDKVFYKYEIFLDKVYVEYLNKIGVVDDREKSSFLDVLDEILKDFEEDKIHFSYEKEDIHTHIEDELVKRLGDLGKKIHTGRSRNDLVLTDFMLYIKEHIKILKEAIFKLLEMFVEIAERYEDTPFIGYTHLQPAQPILVSFWALGYFYKFLRDYNNLSWYEEEHLLFPLGCAALAGSNYDIDRKELMNRLGFNRLYDNCLDAVSSRDFVFLLHGFLTLIGIHLSNIAEEFIIWNTAEFGYIELSDSITTGSSIMPQKKNPDSLELIRGKTASLIGNLVQIATLLKGLPTVYNRDLQEDKPYLFDSIKTVYLSLLVMIEVLKGVKFKENIIKESMKRGFIEATDLADYLVEKGVPFREAHRIVGDLVRHCISSKRKLKDLSIEEYKKFSNVFDRDLFDFIEIKNVINRKNVYGGTSLYRVKESIKQAKEILSSLGG